MTALLPRLLKVAPFIVLGILIAALLVQRQTVIRIAGERDRLVTVVTEATVPPDAKGRRKALTPDEALAAARGLARDRDDARGSLATISQRTVAAKKRDVAADTALVRTQAANVREFARVAPRIEALATAKPTGRPDTDAAAIDVDSRAAWEGWQ